MLSFISRLQKTRSFVLFLFAGVMVLSLVLFYAPTNPDIAANLVRSTETAATVSGNTITVGEVARQKESYSRFMQGRGYPTRMALDGLISSRIARSEAARLGLTASDAEVAAEIRRQFTPQDGKPFDQKQYEQNVTAQFGSVSDFEERMRDDISANKLRAFISSSVTVSEDEVLEDYKRRNTKFDVSYVSVSSMDLARSINPTDEELAAYFEKNKQSYYINVPQKNIQYVFLSTSKLGEKMNISEEDLKAEYDKLPDDRKIAGVSGQEIVLRVASPQFEPQVQQKAMELIAEMRKDSEIVSEEAFAELAHGHSENAATSRVGGRIPGLVRENLNNPTDPYQRLLSMKPGEITEPISYEGRYFILRRGEAKPKSFEDAKKEIEVSLRNRRAYAATAELAEKALAVLKQNKDPKATAEQFAAEANMNVEDMIRETGFVKPGDMVDKIGISPQFEEGIVSMENKTDVGEKIPIQEGFALPLLLDRKEPRDAELAEVKDQVTEVVRLEKAREQVEEIAKKIAETSGNAGGLSAAATANNMKAAESKEFILGSPLGDGPTATTSTELENAIYGMKSGDVTKTPIKIGDNWYVVAVNSRTEADMDEYAKEKDSLTEQFLNRKRGEVYADYLASTRRSLEAAGRIRIYNEAIAKLDALDNQSGLPTGMPPQ